VVDVTRRSRLRLGALLVVLSLGAVLGWLALRKPVAPLPAAENACDALALRLCRELGETSSACLLAERDTRSFSTARCESMLGRYPQVVSELRQLDLGTRELTARQQLSPHGQAPQLGPADAQLTLVMFSDFQSSDCARASPLAALATNLYPGRVRVVFRQYPSSQHPDAHLAAEASLAAHAQGKFWAYHDVLFANPQNLQRGALERYASEVGLDLAAFRQALDTRRFAADVAADVELGHKVQALDLPSLYANGRRVSVPYGVTELSTLVEATLGLRAQR
jgi:protein-disulfide isomerase